MGFGSSVGLSVLVLATGVLSLGLEEPADPAKQPSADPAARREFAGDDAKRVEELEKKIEELRQAGNYSEAQSAARMLLEIRSRVQGTKHRGWSMKTVGPTTRAGGPAAGVMARISLRGGPARGNGRPAEGGAQI